MASPLVQELERQMPETADSDDAHLMGGQHTAFEERVEYRDTAAKQWPGLGQIDALRNGRGPTPMAANLGGEGAMPADDGLLEALAHVVIAGEALAAVQATGGIPAQPHGLSDVDRLGAVAQGGNFPNGFMPGDEGILRDLPVVVQHRKVGMANAAIVDVDFDLLVGQRTQVVGQRPQFSSRLPRAQCVNLKHANYGLPA